MWHPEQELYLKNLGEQAMAYTWMQEKTASFYSKIDKILSILIILISGAVGTTKFLEPLTVKDILIGCLGYIVTILGMLNQFIKPLEASQERINIGNKFQDIYYDIKQQLAKPKEERKHPEEYLENITNKFLELYDFSPQINSFVVQQFKTKFNKSNISMPLNTDFIQAIHIYNNQIHNDIEKGKKHTPSEFQQFILSRLSNT